ncbi:HAMP domain-containing sensor histidine kinase [uncultured Microbacterium sp.]|uniref:sensor histidine kinase n=1 Tax=uncultured Microbacterium sp. TaxID=191216 RepID=UPI0025DE2FE2|nr:HAMP domain-containing sensor histidine kinase [uncultured Microbacterium sp.]
MRDLIPPGAGKIAPGSAVLWRAEGDGMPERSIWTPLLPRQLFVRLHLPFLLGVTLLSVAMLGAVPELERSLELWLGLGVVAAASALFLLPRQTWMHTGWIIVIPVLDIVSIALVRTALLPYLPSAGLLALIPFAWIAYRFGWPGLALILVSGIVIAGLPFVLGGRPVTTLLALVNVLTLPFISTGISVAIHLGSRNFEMRRRMSEEATAKLRAALEQSHEAQLLLRSVFDTVSGAVAYYSARNELVLANATAAKMVDIVGFRLDVPPYAGPDALMADRKTRIPLEHQIIPRALRGEIIANHIEWLGPPGSQIAIMASSRRVHREDGRLLGTVIAAYDVTELVEAIEVREEFLTTVSHELRTPLTSIIGYTEEIVDVLGEGAKTLGIDSWLATIVRNTDTLLERVSELLTVADSQMQLDSRGVDVASMIARAVEPFALVADRAGIELLTDVSADLHIEADPTRLAQVVENLVGNATKFTGRGGRVTVSARRRSDVEVSISVADTGIGMTADVQRRVFDRFYRAQAVRDDAIQGIGVGMSIVKKIVDAHGGEIAIESAPGVGTTVTVVLPTRSAASPDPAVQAVASA